MYNKNIKSIWSKFDIFYNQDAAGEYLRVGIRNRAEYGTAGVEFSSVVIALHTQEEIAQFARSGGYW
jgi:hypothetical protein